MEKASNLKDVEKVVNKGVIELTDDTKVFRMLKMSAGWKKLQKGPQSTGAIRWQKSM